MPSGRIIVLTLWRDALLPTLRRMRGRRGGGGGRPAPRPPPLPHPAHKTANKKHTHPPARAPDPGAEPPPDPGTDGASRHKCAGESEPARKSRCISGRSAAIYTGRLG